MSVYFSETTRRYIPEGCRLHAHRRENLESYESDIVSMFYFVIIFILIIWHY
jgi:hypothetical protein